MLLQPAQGSDAGQRLLGSRTQGEPMLSVLPLAAHLTAAGSPSWCLVLDHREDMHGVQL